MSESNTGGMSDSELEHALDHDAKQKGRTPDADAHEALKAKLRGLRAELIGRSDLMTNKALWPKIYEYGSLYLQVDLAESMHLLSLELGVTPEWLAGLSEKIGAELEKTVPGTSGV